MKHKKILPKHHTGKLAHHRHTSYSALIGVLLLSFMPLFVVSREVVTAAATDPVNGNYSTYAVVPAAIPETAPVISNPVNGSIFTDGNAVAVAGTCSNDTLIKIFKNDVFAGAEFCDNGRFNIDIALFVGSNALIARAYNANDIVGPASTVVSLRRDLPGAGATTPTPADQFFVSSDVRYKGVAVGEKITWPLILSGGQAPYAVSISWGDGKSDLISRAQPGPFDISHIYDKAGGGPQSSFDITVIATDAAGTKSFINLVNIVSGDDSTLVGTIKAGYNWSDALKVAWQLALIAILIILSFWLGERREAFILKRRSGSL